MFFVTRNQTLRLVETAPGMEAVILFLQKKDKSVQPARGAIIRIQRTY